MQDWHIRKGRSIASRHVSIQVRMNEMHEKRLARTEARVLQAGYVNCLAWKAAQGMEVELLI
jgi:hypothetical protein